MLAVRLRKSGTLAHDAVPRNQVHSRWTFVAPGRATLKSDHVEPNSSAHASYLDESAAVGLVLASAFATSSAVTRPITAVGAPDLFIFAPGAGFACLRMLTGRLASSVASSCVKRRRSGAMAASLHTSTRSDPEYPSVHAATASRSHSLSTRSGGSSFCRIHRLPTCPGLGTRMRFSSRRSRALSNSHGRFVAHSTNAWSVLVCNPSICTSSSVFMRRDPSCSPPSPREPMIESISSMKTVEGE
mmetsp:Transcript_5440/g.14215  ORF Transcript_5440/g.14215 Transcript_5440/m.14215 type:complete len:244 (+) Transcript_5440:79-810(+)